MNPFDPIVNNYLIEGYGKPRLIDGLLYMEKISDTPFRYFRECVIPKPTNVILPFSTALCNRLYELSRQDVEYMGSFTMQKEMVMTWNKRGSRFETSSNLQWTYMFHTHPIEAHIPFSFFSTPDITTYYNSYNPNAKNYLTTESGLYSIQLTQEIPLLYLQRVHDYMLSRYIGRDNVYVTLYEMIDFMNRLDGETIYNILCDEHLLNADEYRGLSRDILSVKNIYYVNYKEWALILEEGFTDWRY